MPRGGIFLESEPKRHGLEYCSCIAREVVGVKPPTSWAVEFDGNYSENVRRLKPYPKGDDPMSYWGVGHGNNAIYTVECTTEFLNAKTGENLDLMKNRVVHLLSCNTARELGPALIRNGTTSYVGYSRPFVFGCWTWGAARPDPCDRPKPGADFYSFGRCDLEIQGQLLNGRTVGESVEASQSMFEDYIEKYETGEWSDRPVAPYAARYLAHDKACQRQLGDSDARITLPTESQMLAGLGIVAAGGVATVAASAWMKGR